jgi:hypothetical protein
MYTAWRSKLPAALLIVGVLLFACMFLAGAPATLIPASQTPGTTPIASQVLPEASSTIAAPPTATATVTPSASSTQTPSPTPEPAVVFAVIGDYGSGTRNERQVADLVKSWQPAFIITTGDNNYPSGSGETIDAAIGQFYHEFISPYKGDFGEGAEQNRFFPSLGNHDWLTNSGDPYFDYFSLPGNERYYDFTWGPLQLFSVNSDYNEPDGIDRISEQAGWLQDEMEGSEAPWQIVYFHHAPYSSGLHGSNDWMRWPFKDWGADAVLSGHDHHYERLLIDDLAYFVNGIGGGAIYSYDAPLEGSEVRFNDAYGAMRVEATSHKITFQLITISGEVVDTYEIEQ